MAVDVATFRSRFVRRGEFSGVADDEIQESIDDAKIVFRASEIGTLYLAAHLLQVDIEEKKNVGGDVYASEGMGPHSESYRAASPDRLEPIYGTTKYGRRFLLYKRTATAVRLTVL